MKKEILKFLIKTLFKTALVGFRGLVENDIFSKVVMPAQAEI